MISPMTPPGTRVVCIKNTGVEHILTVGQVYVVERMNLLRAAQHSNTGEIHLNVVAVQVRGVMCPGCGQHLGNFERAAFEYAVLPKAITELLTTAPVDAPVPVTVP